MSKLLKFDNVNLDKLHYKYEMPSCNSNGQTEENNDKSEIFGNTSLCEEAQKIIDNAEKESSQIIKTAFKKADLEYQKAREEGYKSGYVEGRKQAQNENNAVINELLSFIKNLEDQKEAILSAHNSEAKKLALEVARKVIDKKMAADDQIFLNIYEKAIQELTGQKTAKLLVSKNEYYFASSNIDYLLTLSKSLEYIEVIALDDAPAGTYILETENEVIDASIDTQFQVLEQLFSV